MTVIPLESLPLGFRFRPTDEELVNHYLKRKITGEIGGDRAVIPEIDVCKCEPWDLPDKALIRSDDPEWFFFAPKDRKYPNGSRSNRATEKGYWKATGKDRVIRNKGPAKQQAGVIGMKKTLVFHKGRAPRGERTHWIMHEYRTTEPEFESGDQGGYVLYRLFKKSDEIKAGPTNMDPANLDEVNRSGFSPTPSRSSPGGTNLDADASEEIATTPPTAEHKVPAAVLQNDAFILPNSAGIKRWLDDRADSGMNSYTAKQDGNLGGVREKPGPTSDLLAQLFEQQNHTNQGVQNQVMDGYANGDNINPDAINHFLNSVLIDPDEYSSGASKVQEDPADAELAVEDYLENGGMIQGDTNQDGANWLVDGVNFDEILTNFSDECPELKLQGMLYENANLLPYDSTDQDVYSVDSGAESLQDLFNTMEDSSTQKNRDSTGIIIQPRRYPYPNPNPSTLFTGQGSAPRRAMLQMDLHTGSETGSNSKDDYGEEETSINNININNNNAQKEEEPTGIVIRLRERAPLHQVVNRQGMAVRRICLQSYLKVGAMSGFGSVSTNADNKTEIQEHVDQNLAEGVADKPEELTVHDEDAPHPSELNQETAKEETLRLRKKAIHKKDRNINEIKSLDGPKSAPKRNSTFGYLVWFAISMMAFVVVCVGVKKVLSSPFP